MYVTGVPIATPAMHQDTYLQECDGCKRLDLFCGMANIRAKQLDVVDDTWPNLVRLLKHLLLLKLCLI